MTVGGYAADADPPTASGRRRNRSLVPGVSCRGRTAPARSPTAACNRYHGTVEVAGDELAIGAVAITRMACADPTAMAAETAYLAGFTAAARWSIERDTLQLTGPGVQLAFRRER